MPVDFLLKSGPCLGALTFDVELYALPHAFGHGDAPALRRLSNEASLRRQIISKDVDGLVSCVKLCQTEAQMKDFTTYLIFDGNCRDAMTFYKNCLDAELNIFPFSQAADPMPAEAKDRTMHASIARRGKP